MLRQSLRCLLERIWIASRDNDMASLCRQRICDRQTNPTIAARDDRNLTAKSARGFLLGAEKFRRHLGAVCPLPYEGQEFCTRLLLFAEAT